MDTLKRTLYSHSHPHPSFFRSPSFVDDDFPRVKRMKLSADDVSDCPSLFDLYDTPNKNSDFIFSFPPEDIHPLDIQNEQIIYDSIEPSELFRQGSNAWFTYCDRCEGQGCIACNKTWNNITLLQPQCVQKQSDMISCEQSNQFNSDPNSFPPTSGFNLPMKPDPELIEQQSTQISELLFENAQQQLEHPVPFQPSSTPSTPSTSESIPVPSITTGRLSKFLPDGVTTRLKEKQIQEHEHELELEHQHIETEQPSNQDDDSTKSDHESSEEAEIESEEEWNEKPITPKRRSAGRIRSRRPSIVPTPSAPKPKRKIAKSQPSESKDRHVKSGVILKASEDDSDTSHVSVDAIYYTRPGLKPSKIRLINVTDEHGSLRTYAHGADVGGVVERKSNISRLFGKFESPSEKLLINVVGVHNHTVGQQSNILTSLGVERFLNTNKMKAHIQLDGGHYKKWIEKELLPKLREREQKANSEQQQKQKKQQKNTNTNLSRIHSRSPILEEDSLPPLAPVTYDSESEQSSSEED
jgi:hypothetical protein